MTRRWTQIVLTIPLMIFFAAAAWSEPLITTEEASLPDQSISSFELRAITRGPGIERISPKDGGSANSPLPFVFRFTPRNSIPIDETSVRLTYLKKPSINLTPRVRAFLAPSGIDMKNAEIPPGTHYVRIDVKDKQDRSSYAVYEIVVGTK